PNQTIDTRVWNELLNFWNSVGLVAGSAENAAKVDQAINVYEKTRSQDYAEYWRIRNGQNAPTTFDATWSYIASAAEVRALTARTPGNAQQSIAEFEKDRTDRYWALNGEISTFDPQVYARSADAAKVRQQYPGFTQQQIAARVLSDEQNGLLPVGGPSNL